jgi:hypothetical protein
MNGNEITKFENWLWEKTTRTENCKKQLIHPGNLTLSLKFLVDQWGSANPLDISLHAPILSPNRLEFQLVDAKRNESTTQFIKRIHHTPFYYSYLSDEAYSLKIADFFLWNPSSVIYRIFILQKYQGNCSLSIRFPEKVRSSVAKQNIRIANFYCKISQPVDLEKENRCVAIKIDKTMNEQAIVIAISSTPIDQDISFTLAFQLLRQLEETCRVAHPGKNFIVNYAAAEKKMAELWTLQKYIHPDHTIDRAILNNPDQYDRELTWLVELCCYLGWHEPLMEIWKSLKENIKQEKLNWRLSYTACYLENYLNMRDQDRFITKLIKKNMDDHQSIFYQFCQKNFKNISQCKQEDFIYASYFMHSLEERPIIEFLQKWWDCIGLPLFSNKLLQEVFANQEKILIILLLAIRYQLPWAPVLMQYLDQYPFAPLFRIIGLLFSRLSVRHAMDDKIYLFYGFLWDNNVKRLFRNNNLSYAFTKFSKNSYLTIKQNNKIVLKINIPVHVIHDRKCNELAIYPAVFKIGQPDYHLAKIKVADRTLNLPLVFSKGELFFYDVRLRWIFKKRRFQFTLMCKEKEKQVFINNQEIRFNCSVKQKHYISVFPQNAKIELMILSEKGRSVHFNKTVNRRTVQLYGWAMDRHGIFTSHFNFRYNRKQYLHQIDQCGLINKIIHVPPEVKSITFFIKKAQRELTLKFHSSLFLERMFKFSPQKWTDHFIVLIDGKLKKDMDTIQQFFHEFFAFQPEYCFKHAGMKPIQSAIVIYLTLSAADIRIMEDHAISLYPICRIGIKKGIRDLFKLYPFIIMQGNGK